MCRSIPSRSSGQSKIARTALTTGRQPPIERYFHAKSLQVDIPGVDDWVQERDAAIEGDLKYISVEKLQHRDAHLFEAAPAVLSD